MKKTGLLFFVVCMSVTAAFAQNTIDIYSTGAAGSFTTGNCTSTARVDNTIAAQNFPSPKRGYAVFDLNAIPASATVTSVELHFNKESVVGPGGGAYSTRGHLGDLSTITVPGTLYTTMGIAPQIFSSPYGGTVGNTFLGTDPLAETFVDTNIGRKVSIIWTTTAPRVYAITGQTGAATPTGTHAPFLRVNYDCPGITSFTAGGPSVTPCPNVAFDLSGSATGTIASYAWSGPLGFSSTLANPTVTAGLPSSGVYTLTVTDASGCSLNATTLVTVFSAPPTGIVPVTPTAFCEGSDATLNAPVLTGATYQWYDSGTPIFGATDAVFVTLTSGNYKVQVTDANGCVGMTALGTPTVMLSTPPVSPVGPILLCSGDNGTITVNTNGVTSGLTYQWQKDGVDLPGSVGPSHVASISGVYRCIISVPLSGCTAPSAEITVDVNSYPLPTISYSGSTLSTPGLYSSYQWFLNTVAIAGATSSSVIPSSTGSYRVRVTDANGCTAFSPGFSVNIVGVGILNTGNISLYPNPVKDMLRIDAPFVVSAVISSIDGKEISKHNNATQIDLHSLPTGLYLIAIYNEAGDRIKVEKITKQ